MRRAINNISEYEFFASNEFAFSILSIDRMRRCRNFRTVKSSAFLCEYASANPMVKEIVIMPNMQFFCGHSSGHYRLCRYLIYVELGKYRIDTKILSHFCQMVATTPVSDDVLIAPDLTIRRWKVDEALLPELPYGRACHCHV